MSIFMRILSESGKKSLTIGRFSDIISLADVSRDAEVSELADEQD